LGGSDVIDDFCPSDESGLDAAQKIVAIGFGLLKDFRLIAVLEGHFLQHEFHSVFGLKTLSDQLADTGSKAFVIGGTQTGEMIGALVVAEFSGGKAIIGGAGLGIFEQLWERIGPLTLGAGPALKSVTRGPNQLARSSRLQVANVVTAGIHELHDSRTKKSVAMALCYQE
jgi:hypothetical protein